MLRTTGTARSFTLLETLRVYARYAGIPTLRRRFVVPPGVRAIAAMWRNVERWEWGRMLAVRVNPEVGGRRMLLRVELRFMRRIGLC